MTIQPKIFFPVSALILITFSAIAVTAQPPSKPSPTDLDPLRSVFVDILLAKDRPGGSVIIEKTCGKETAFARQRQPVGSHENPLDFLAKTNSDYRIINESDVINLMPADYEPAILKTRINDYFIDSDKSISVTLDELLALNELKGQVDAANLNKGMQLMIGGSWPRLPGPRRVKSLSYVTVRQALNEIAIFYGNGIWAYTEYRCEGKTRSSLSFQKG